MTNTNKCPICGNQEMKTGKLHNVATLHSLDSRVGIGGSELHMTFCSKCGEVVGIKVIDPNKIK